MLRRILFTPCLLLMAMWFFSACAPQTPEDPCVTNPPGCVNGTCVVGVGTCDCDAGFEGEVCDELVDIDLCLPPDCQPYVQIQAAQLAPTGCETYIGAHPVHPGELLCCSESTLPSIAPECLPGVDVPDIPCVVELEFCDDSSFMKAWSPQPVSGYPGHSISSSGSWSIDPDTGELETIFVASTMNGGLNTVSTETYSSAFTYDNGTKLDLYSSVATNTNAGGIGYYHRHASSLTDISGIWTAILDADLNTEVTVSATGYESTYTEDIACNPPLGMVCLVTPLSAETTTSGAHQLPLELYLIPTGNGEVMFQTDKAKALVFELQANSCDAIECGVFGSCEDGACACTGGWEGPFCTEEGLCVGVDCGANGSCVEGACECDTGYEGNSCEVDINECTPNPCLNGGSCAEGVAGTYDCTCTDGYAGDDCEICPTDADGDGYGDPASAFCIYPELDCNDNYATVYPGAPELCDKLDNQCAGDAGHGVIDEGYTVCADMVSIPSGCFNMGDAFAEGWPDEQPVHNVCLSAFEMDIHEITNAEYAECVATGVCDAPNSFSSYSRETYYGNPVYNNYPVIWMKWHHVDEFCNWAGKRLPTEAEWEYAARGGLAGKRFPWGDTISSTDANYDFNVGDTTAVESYAPNDYGLYDVTGNVWEWVADWYSESSYSVSPTNDPTGAASGIAPVRRGGSWDHDEFGCRVATRCDFCHADRHGNNLGGRCAR